MGPKVKLKVEMQQSLTKVKQNKHYLRFLKEMLKKVLKKKTKMRRSQSRLNDQCKR